MKKFFIISYILIITIISCDKTFDFPTDSISYQMENFGHDELVHQYILDYFNQYERIQDVTLLEKVINNKSVNLDDTTDIHKVFGYSNYDEFNNDMVKQRNRAQELDRRYG